MPARKCRRRSIPIPAPIPACEVMSEAPTVFQRRIIIGAVLSAAAFALVGIRLAHVTLMRPLDTGREAAAVIARADLTDRNGELLARDLPVKDLYARPMSSGTSRRRRTIWPSPPARTRDACSTPSTT